MKCSVLRLEAFQLTLLISTICLISVSDSHGQSIEWERTFGNTLITERSESIVAHSSNGFILLGRSFDGIGQDEIYVIRLDDDGNTIWSKRYFGDESEEIGFDIIMSFEGNPVICGYRHSFVDTNCQEIFLSKLDTLGDTVWTKTYGGTFCDRAKSIVQTVDSGFVLAGFLRENSAQDIKGFILRTDKNGDSLWSRIFGSGVSFPFDKVIIEDVIVLQNGDFLVSGARNDDDSLTHDIYAARISSTGTLLWEVHYGNATIQKALSSAQLSNGSIIYVGYQLMSGQPPNFLIINTDINGDSIASLVFGDTLSNVCIDVISTDDGGFLFCGDNTNSVQPRFYSVTVAKFDSTLSQEWSLSIEGGEEINSKAIRRTLDGGYILSGYKKTVNDFGQLYVAKIQGPPCCQGIRGDVNGDGPDANILDLTYLVDFIFRGSGDPGGCPDESDVNGDGNAGNILDLTYLVDVIFRGGPVPPGC